MSAASEAGQAATTTVITPVTAEASIDANLPAEQPLTPTGVVALAKDLAEGTKWPGGVVGGFGAALIALALAAEEIGDRLVTAEFVVVVIVGALLTVVGPLISAYMDLAARRTAVEVDNTNKARADRQFELMRARQEYESRQKEVGH